MLKAITEKVIVTVLSTAVIAAGAYAFYYLKGKIDALEQVVMKVQSLETMPDKINTVEERVTNNRDVKNLQVLWHDQKQRLDDIERMLNEIRGRNNNSIDAQIEAIKRQPDSPENARKIGDLIGNKVHSRQEIMDGLSKWERQEATDGM